MLELVIDLCFYEIGYELFRCLNYLILVGINSLLWLNFFFLLNSDAIVGLLMGWLFMRHLIQICLHVFWWKFMMRSIEFSIIWCSPSWNVQLLFLFFLMTAFGSSSRHMTQLLRRHQVKTRIIWRHYRILSQWFPFFEWCFYEELLLLLLSFW